MIKWYELMQEQIIGALEYTSRVPSSALFELRDPLTEDDYNLWAFSRIRALFRIVAWIWGSYYFRVFIGSEYQNGNAQRYCHLSSWSIASASILSRRRRLSHPRGTWTWWVLWRGVIAFASISRLSNSWRLIPWKWIRNKIGTYTGSTSNLSTWSLSKHRER